MAVEASSINSANLSFYVIGLICLYFSANIQLKSVRFSIASYILIISNQVITRPLLSLATVVFDFCFIASNNIEIICLH